MLRIMQVCHSLYAREAEYAAPHIFVFVMYAQENGEQVMVLCAALRKSSPLLFSVADLGVAVLPHPLTLSRSTVSHSHVDGHAACVQGSQPEDASGFVQSVLSSSVQAGAPAAAAPLPQPMPTLFEAQHPQLLLATTLASLHCALVLPGDAPPHVLLRVLNEARRGCDAMRQTLSFALAAQLSLALLVLVDVAAALPPVLPLHYLLFLVWVSIPCIALPMLTAPPDDLHMTSKRTPIKRTAGNGGVALWDILPAPTVSAESLPAAPGDVLAAQDTLDLKVDGLGEGGVARKPAEFDARTTEAAAAEHALPSGTGKSRRSITGSLSKDAMASPAGRASRRSLNLNDVDQRRHSVDGDVQLGPGHFDVAAGLEDGTAASDAQFAPVVFLGDAEGDEEVVVPQTLSPLTPLSRSPIGCPASALSAAILPHDTVPLSAVATAAASLSALGESTPAPHAAGSSVDPQPESPLAAQVGGGSGGADVARGGATTYNPVTGGVHAEGLIRYGTYSDSCGVLAGNTVDITSASADRLVSMLRTGAAGSTVDPPRTTGMALRRKSSRRPGQLLSSASAAAAAASFSMGIAPAQGLLDKPPPPPLPQSWARLTVYALAALLPSAVFHEYLYTRVLLAGLAQDSLATSGPAWGRYPVIESNATAAQLSLRGAWARAFVHFALVFWLAVTSSHFVYRSLPWWKANPLRCRWWAAGCCASVVLTLLFCHACTAAVGAPSLFAGSPWDAWLAIALFNIASFAVVGAVKGHDGRVYERLMMSLRLYFDTRLGMYSPR